MRVTIVAGGSRGDVQPLVALGLGIQAAGHVVTIAADADSARLIQGHGLGFHGFDVSIQEQMRTDAGRAWVADSAGRPLRELRHMRAVFAETAQPLATALLTLSGTADHFISGILTLDAMAAIAQHDGVAHTTALLSPFHPTANGRAGLTAPFSGTHLANRVAARAALQVLAGNVTRVSRLVRRSLGQRESGSRAFARTLRITTAAVGVSSVLVPSPPEWPTSVSVTGPWTLPVPSDYQPPRDLADFLAAGPAPLYLGFGSMSVVQPVRIREIATAAAHRAGLRLVLGGTDLVGPDGDDVVGVADVPHTWLLPQVRAAVHHGGAGTTHAALLAGVPQLVVPHIADQPYWGRRLHEEGLGPAPLTLDALTVDALTDRITAVVGNDRYARRAAALGEKARHQQGVPNAVGVLLG